MRAIKCLPKLAESLQRAYSAHAASIVAHAANMWVLANTHQCSPLLAVLVFAEKGKKCAQKSDARKMLSCPHNVCNAYEMLAWCDRCMVDPVIYMNVNLVTFNESAHAASTLKAPSSIIRTL